MSLFLNHNNINDSIIFCVKYISDNGIGTKISEDNELKIDFSKYRYSSKSIKKILIYYSILDEDLVRIANISKYIKINTFREFNFSNYNKELIVYDDQIKHGRKWISLYIKNLKENQLDVKLIITLDMFRGALKVSNGQYDKELWNNLNNYLDK